MRIEVCSQADALLLAAGAEEKTAVVSITSTGDGPVAFAENPNIEAILRLSFNDLVTEYDEEGFPYGLPLPVQADLAGLKAFVDSLSCRWLIVHCWEGTSRSAAVAAAVCEYRGRQDELRTRQRFAPNPLVYALACRELGIRQGDLRYGRTEEKGAFTVVKRG